MSLIDANIIDNAIGKVAVINQRLIYIKYLITLKYFMENLFHERIKSDKVLSNFSVYDVFKDCSPGAETDGLVERLIEPIAIINNIIEDEIELLLKYEVVFEPFKSI